MLIADAFSQPLLGDAIVGGAIGGRRGAAIGAASGDAVGAQRRYSLDLLVGAGDQQPEGRGQARW
jgi:hypothetical protein